MIESCPLEHGIRNHWHIHLEVVSFRLPRLEAQFHLSLDWEKVSQQLILQDLFLAIWHVDDSREENQEQLNEAHMTDFVRDCHVVHDDDGRVLAFEKTMPHGMLLPWLILLPLYSDS